jgi:uncharacterized membrane protein YdjX (TVP38/TMEM64 family)
MFLSMRREAVDRKAAPLPEHAGLLAYERRGISKRYSYYAIPDRCYTVFFPGCTFTGTRPEQTISLYNHLKSYDPCLGMVLDCCCKPSHDLGRWDFFSAMNNELKSFLVDHGVRQIITACPNCHTTLKSYGDPLKVISIYEKLDQCGLPKTGRLQENVAVSIHDPCVTRFESSVHKSARKLAAKKGFSVIDMAHSRKKTLCCGEGGNVGPIAPRFADIWLQRRCEEANGQKMLTYCAGCANRLKSHAPTFHIADAILDPQSVVSGKVRVSTPPWTYLNRLRVKRFLKKQHRDGITRERMFSPDSSSGGKGMRRVFILLTLALVIGMLHVSGVSRFLDQQFLSQWVTSWGIFAPILYMLVFTLAPVLFLPGLPITMAGGILFGPVWGVVYTIFGATAGACSAFLVARYVARDWVSGRLTSPRWKQLDEKTARHGWKIVIFTRLIPLFPFNMLNYAFGLTSVSFGHYAVATFVGMLPACIAFIVFSSSLPDLIRGKMSVEFWAGTVLMVAVMMTPALYHYFRAKKRVQVKKKDKIDHHVEK